jgi:arylsulfatase A-like enzyme
VSKWYPYEEAVKVPLVMTCSDRIPARSDEDHLVSGADVMATLCAIAGVRAPDRQQGRSLVPLLEGRDVTWREFVASEFRRDGRVIRSDWYKYVRYYGDPVEQLFDMKNDPWETMNLFREAEYADVLADHRKMLAQWEASLEPVQPT